MKFTAALIALAGMTTVAALDVPVGPSGDTDEAGIERALRPYDQECRCHGALSYKVVEYCDIRNRDGSYPFQCSRRGLGSSVGGSTAADDSANRKLGSLVGATFDQWVNYVRTFEEGCALAPVRSKEDLEYYDAISPSVETLLGIIKADEKQAFQCGLKNEFGSSRDQNGDSSECLEGWINIVDGSAVPDDKDLWSGPAPQGLANFQIPNTVERTVPRTVANLATTSPVMWDQCQGDGCFLFPHALLECCEQTVTCYSRRIVIS